MNIWNHLGATIIGMAWACMGNMFELNHMHFHLSWTVQREISMCSNMIGIRLKLRNKSIHGISPFWMHQFLSDIPLSYNLGYIIEVTWRCANFARIHLTPRPHLHAALHSCLWKELKVILLCPEASQCSLSHCNWCILKYFYHNIFLCF